MTTEEPNLEALERIAEALKRIAPAWAYEQAERELKERNGVPLADVPASELHVQIGWLLKCARALYTERDGASARGGEAAPV